MQVRAEFRKILMFMGFEEMPTNRWVESSFWNFDSLFQPQVSASCSPRWSGFVIADPTRALPAARAGVNLASGAWLTLVFFLACGIQKQYHFSGLCVGCPSCVRVSGICEGRAVPAPGKSLSHTPLCMFWARYFRCVEIHPGDFWC